MSTTSTEQNVSVNLFNGYDDKTEEVKTQFVVLDENHYIPRLKNYYSAADDFMTCDCQQEYDDDDINWACGADSDCINRLTNIECVNDQCNCGDDCQNQRFQKHQFADTSIFLTAKKGYGMRANVDIPAGTFIIEYMGDIIDQEEYGIRKEKYGTEGVKHFYFMMIQDNEIIDATKRASLARYCNHSCDPNAYVDKWVVKKRFKMGIFAKRDITMGEEICFDYNVDRYGAEPQKCYCGTANCIGVMGGKTQSESVRLLPHSITEALGVTAANEKKWLKIQKDNGIKVTKANIDSNVNVEFVKSLELEPLSVDEVAKVVSCLMQPELDVVVLKRIFERFYMNEEETEYLTQRFNRLHGLQALGHACKSFLSTIHDGKLSDDHYEVAKQIIGILKLWPQLRTKNSVQNSNLEDYLNKLKSFMTNDTEFCQLIEEIIQNWSSLKIEFRIPKRINSSESRSSSALFDDRRSRSEEPSKAKLPSAPAAQKPWGDLNVAALPANKKIDDYPLPTGWEWAHDTNTNKKYFFNRESGMSAWEKPEWPQIKQLANKKEEEERQLRRERDHEKELRRIQQDLERTRKLESQQKSRSERERNNELNNMINQAKKDAAEAILKKEKEEEKRQKKLEAKEKNKKKPKMESSKQIKQVDEKKLAAAEKKWVNLLAKYIPSMIKKYQELLGHDNIKKFGREITHLLAEKEVKRHGVDYKVPSSLNEDRKNKTKLFAKEYVHKQISKIKDRKKKRKLDEAGEFPTEKKQKS